MAGNIRSKTEGNSTASYGYDCASWHDLLTSFNGQSIACEGQTYANGSVSGDVLSGNPMSYYNGRRYDFSKSRANKKNPLRYKRLSS